MDEKSIRERIRLKLALGHLKHHDGMVVAAAMGSRQPCQACGLQIDPSHAAPHGHAYANGTHWFHVACHALWAEERKPTTPLGEDAVRVQDSTR
jgi:hypothetical protein